jgi:hypothetical protein
MLSDLFDIEFYADHGIDTEPKVLFGTRKWFIAYQIGLVDWATIFSKYPMR